MTENSQLVGYTYCKDHDIYYPDSKQCCPACQIQIVESYLDRLVQVRDHYHKVGEGWGKPEGFRVTQEMATGQPGQNHRTDIFKDQPVFEKEEEKTDGHNGKE